MSSINQKACQNRRYYVTDIDTRVVCPPRDERVWDAHPRVYLTLDEHGRVLCPYCSTEFILKAKPYGNK